MGLNLLGDLRQRSKRTASSSLIICSVVLAIGLWAIGAYLLWSMRGRELAEARQTGDNIVATMAAEIGRNIDMFDLSVQAVADGLDHPGVAALSKDLRQLLLFDRAATAKYLSSIKVLDKDGFVSVDSRTLAPVRADYSARDYFLVHKDNPSAGLYLGHPFLSHRSIWLIGISRRLSAPDGSFAGVVVGTMQLDYFKDMFARLTLPPDSAVSLINTDGALLMRSPFRANEIGRDLSMSKTYKSAIDSDDAHYEAVATLDGLHRIYSSRKVGEYPLIVTVGFSSAQVLSGWRSGALLVGALMILLGSATIGLSVVAARELRRRLTIEGRLRNLAATDTLTGLGNRRKFDDGINLAWSDGLEKGTPLSVVMIDVDHFKDFNDQHGHQAGDQALATIGKIIGSLRRGDTDIAARYGGEEFAMILPGTTADNAFQIAERIRRRIASERGERRPCPSVSIGLACQVPGAQEEPQALIARADAALYEAKNAGRDCTVDHHNPRRADRGEQRAA